jgi:hypothetical protein
MMINFFHFLLYGKLANGPFRCISVRKALLSSSTYKFRLLHMLRNAYLVRHERSTHHEKELIKGCVKVFHREKKCIGMLIRYNFDLIDTTSASKDLQRVILDQSRRHQGELLETEQVLNIGLLYSSKVQYHHTESEL